MEPEFYAHYKDLSVAELVKVAKSPWDFLPEAVAAAHQVLRERGVSAEEIAAEEWALAQREMLDAATKKRPGDYLDWFWELFQIDRSKEPVEKWFGLFLLLYGLYYVCYLYQGFRFVVFYYRCATCWEMRPAVFQEVVYQLYFTITLFWVMKQKPIDWSLLCIQVIVMNCIKLSLCYHLYQHHVYIRHPENYILPLSLNTVILVFLFRPYILDLFKIDKIIRDRTLALALGLGLVGMAFS
jgi:hypothetical protein